MKSTILKAALVALGVVCASSATEQCAKADGFYFYAGPSFYVAPPVYAYAPVYVAPAPVVSYGYFAGPPVYNLGAVYPAYYYPPAYGVAPYYPSEVKYKWRHGVLKIEIDD
jgi:hypothetical protein